MKPRISSANELNRIRHGTPRTLFVVVELAQENEQLLLIPAEDRLDLWRLLRVRHEHLQSNTVPSSVANTNLDDCTIETRDAYLEDMERLELYILALIPQQIHHHLKIRLRRDISRHDVEVRAVKQNLAEELERLPLRDVVGGEEEGGERGEELNGRTD